MPKKSTVSLAAAVVTLSTFAVFSAPATAGPPTITKADSISVTCSVVGKAKLTPPLKNDWVQSAHSTDPEAGVRNLPDQRFSADGPTTTAAKTKGTCTGTMTQGAITVNVTSVSISSSSTGAPTTPPTPATCSGLASVGTGPGGPTTFSSTMKFKGSNGKIADATVSATVAQSGLGFALTSVSATGSLEGSSSVTQVNVDTPTILAIIGAAATSAEPVPTSIACEPTLVNKKGVWSLKAPKGFKQIGILDTSTLTITK